MIRLGGHGLPVNSDDPYAFARAHTTFGYGAAYCPPISVSDTQRIADFRKAFEAEKVTLAEIGIWRNLIAVEPEVRKKHREYARECLAVADEVGAKCAVSYIGTYLPNSDYAPHAKNLTQEAFDETVETARGIIDAVKPKRAKFSLEMQQYALPDSVDNYVTLIKAIDRKEFGAHLDPVNFIFTPRQYFNSGDLIRECFAKLGQWLVSSHAKDIILYHQAALHYDEIMIGDGVLDYRAYLGELAKLPHEVPLMLEHLTDPGYAQARDQIFKVGDEIGVKFVNRPV